MPTDPQTTDQEVEDLLILEQLKLVRFEAEPPSIPMFGASRVSWQLQGSDPRIALDLNGGRVPFTGDRVVTPATTTMLRLRARKGRARRDLGTVVVRVDDSACITETYPEVSRHIMAALEGAIKNDPKLEFRFLVTGFGQPARVRRPELDYADGAIRFKLFLNALVEIEKPKLTIRVPTDVKARFRLEVVQGNIRATDVQISIDPDIPLWAWLIPGAMIGVPIAASFAKDDAHQQLLNAVNGLAALIDLVIFVPTFRRLSAVRVLPVSGALADLEFTHCPDNPLRSMVAVQTSIVE